MLVLYAMSLRPSVCLSQVDVACRAVHLQQLSFLSRREQTDRQAYRHAARNTPRTSQGQVTTTVADEDLMTTLSRHFIKFVRNGVRRGPPEGVHHVKRVFQVCVKSTQRALSYLDKEFVRM